MPALATKTAEQGARAPSDTRPTIYLSGPISNAPDNGSQWRDMVKKKYSDVIKPLCPLDKHDTANDVVTMPAGLEWMVTDEDATVVTDGEVVRADLSMVQQCDGILVGDWAVDIKSDGTSMEMAYNSTYPSPVPIVAVTIDDSRLLDQSTWFRFHVDAVFNNYAPAIQSLITAVGNDHGN